ncbi:MFS transporter [Renibacterium salmoninarum]|uniref:MFS transporter n=1 Tax=Renibacterium salmoninarum TaxID=1646 RepID=UPI0011AB2D98|nr:MFS transporter [Renibacterium salmoninarum]
MPAMTSVALFWAPAEHRGLASGVLNTSRQTGGAIGIAFLGAVIGIAGFAGLVLAMVIVVICYAMAVLSTLQATQSEAKADS